MDWIGEVLKYGSPLLALSLAVLFFGNKIVTSLISNNQKLAESIAIIATKMEVSKND